MAVRIFHCADLHLDSPFSLSSPAKADQRRIELRSAFTSALMIAKQQQTQLFFISGDLFDSEYVTRDTAELIVSELGAFPSCRFFISPGNHDPINDVSPYKTVPFPENVHIFGPSKEKVSIPELNVNVYGFGFGSASYMSCPVAGYGNLDPDAVNILVVHGDTSSPLSKYGPVTKNDIALSGFDYIALGHIHAPTGVLREGNTFYAYPGCLEGRSFDEPGYLKFIRFSKRRYETTSVDVTGAATKQAAIEIIRSKIRSYGNDTIIRVNVTGTVPEPYLIRPSEIGKGYEYPCKIELIDSTVPEIDLTSLEKDTTLKGVFYKKMLDRLAAVPPESEEYATLLAALKYGLSALYDRSITDIEGEDDDD